MDAPYPGVPGKKLATFVCYCSNRICKQTKGLLVDIVGIWILLLLFSIDFKGKHSAFSSDGALYLPFLSLISSPLSYYLPDISLWPTHHEGLFP